MHPPNRAKVHVHVLISLFAYEIDEVLWHASLSGFIPEDPSAIIRNRYWAIKIAVRIPIVRAGTHTQGPEA
jgi:hypothetical protein